MSSPLNKNNSTSNPQNGTQTPVRKIPYGKVPYGSESPVVDQTLLVNTNLRKSQKSLQWGAINAIGAGIFSYDMSLTSEHFRTYIYNIEYVLVIILTLNTIYHVVRYVYNSFTTHPVPVTVKQKKLMGFKDSDSYYKIVDTKFSTPISKSPSSPISPSQASTPNQSFISWRSSSSQQNDSIYSIPSPSWVYHRGSPAQNRQDTTPTSPLTIPDTSGVDSICDETSLNQYLKDYETHEKILNASTNTDDSTQTNLLTSFWSHPATRVCTEVSSFLKNSTYQLSSQAMDKLIGSQGGPTQSDGKTSPTSLTNQGMDVWNELKIAPNTLTLWHSNLRLWIYQTILDRLVSEIDLVNESLTEHGFVDVQIGTVGLERIRKTAQTQPALQYIPTMMSLVPFLEATPNQEYLVQRIRELTNGGCMTDYRWNSGGRYNGKPWEDHLPTDAHIIMHLFATYLDTQLVPLPHQPDARPFTTRHLIRGNEKPGPNSASVIIREVTEKPPYYNLYIGGATRELVKGRNNLFHALLLFIYQQNLIEHGMIGRVNLGKSGVNMLWIIEKS